MDTTYMRLTSYTAGKGDAFLLEWGKEDDKHYLLIDSGIPNTYRFIKRDLANIRKLEAVILTHVDYDHLGGFFKLLADPDAPVTLDHDIFMNTPALALVPPEDDKVALEHGIELEKKLKDKDITCKGLFIGVVDKNTLNLADLEIKVLSPPQAVIDKLIANWTADKLYKKYQEESESSDKAGRNNGTMPTYDAVINGAETAHKWEEDLINSTSIAFIATYDGRSILFLGDANPELVAQELQAMGCTADNRLKVDLVKISHHGSKHNSSKTLYELIECSCFLISTDGTGSYYHPDRETIIRLAEYTRKDKDQPLHIYLNYDLDTTNFITDQEAADWKINIKHQNILDLKDLIACSQKK